MEWFFSWDSQPSSKVYENQRLESLVASTKDGTKPSEKSQEDSKARKPNNPHKPHNFPPPPPPKKTNKTPQTAQNQDTQTPNEPNEEPQKNWNKSPRNQSSSNQNVPKSSEP